MTAVWAPQTPDRLQATRQSGLKGVHCFCTRDPAFESNRALHRVTSRLNSRRLHMKYRLLQTNLTPEKERKKQWNFLASEWKNSLLAPGRGGRAAEGRRETGSKRSSLRCRVLSQPASGPAVAGPTGPASTLPCAPLGGHLERSRQEPGSTLQELMPRLVLWASLKNIPHA